MFMKRLIFTFAIVFSIFIQNSGAQTISMANQTALPCASTSFPITASSLPNGIGAITIYIQVNPAVLIYTGHTPGTISGYLISSVNGLVSISWSFASGANVNGTLLTLNFTYKGGTSATDLTSGCEVSTAIPPEPIACTFTDGSISATPKTSYYVDAAVSVSGSGLSWATALKTITEATNKALNPGDEVQIKPGTYNEALIIKSNGSEIVPVKYNVILSDTNKITFPAGTDLSCVSPASYPGKYYAYVYRSWRGNNGAYPILSVNTASNYVIVDNSAFIPETGAAGDTSLVQACIGLPVVYKKYSANPETERVIVNSSSATNARANCYIGTPIGAAGTAGDSATASNYNILDGLDLTGSPTFKYGLRIQSSSFNVFKNGRIYNLDSVGVYVSGSSLKKATYNFILNNKIYNTKQRALKIGKTGGTTANSNYAYYTHFKDNEVYVQDDASTTNDALWNMADINKSTAFTVISGNTFRSYSSQSAGRGTIDIFDNVRKTNIYGNFIKDVGKSVSGTNSIIYVRNASLNINVFDNVILNSSTINDDIFAFRLNAQGHSDSKVVYNTVYNVDNGFLLEDSGTPVPVFKVQNNIMYINYSGGGIYFTNTGTTGRFTVSNNCYPTTPTTVGQPYDGETGRQVGDPLFVNPTFYSSPHGLQVKTGSNCINHGIAVTTVTRDYSKNARSASTPTIGAFEGALTSITWTGKISNDWHNYLNWSPEIVPTTTIQAIIPLKTNLPVISGANAVCKGLSVQSGANVVINNGRLLNVY
jgi:hypothetical protein